MIAPIRISALNSCKGSECSDALLPRGGATRGDLEIAATEISTHNEIGGTYFSPRVDQAYEVSVGVPTQMISTTTKKNLKKKSGVQLEDFLGGHPS